MLYLLRISNGKNKDGSPEKEKKKKINLRACSFFLLGLQVGTNHQQLPRSPLSSLLRESLRFAKGLS
jgi:hypothetical protein